MRWLTVCLTAVGMGTAVHGGKPFSTPLPFIIKHKPDNSIPEVTD